MNYGNIQGRDDDQVMAPKPAHTRIGRENRETPATALGAAASFYLSRQTSGEQEIVA
jgi:hypothetical protein